MHYLPFYHKLTQHVASGLILLVGVASDPHNVRAWTVQAASCKGS